MRGRQIRRRGPGVAAPPKAEEKVLKLKILSKMKNEKIRKIFIFPGARGARPTMDNKNFQSQKKISCILVCWADLVNKIS